MAMADDLVNLSQLLADARATLKEAIKARAALADQVAAADATVRAATERLTRVRTRVTLLLDSDADQLG